MSRAWLCLPWRGSRLGLDGGMAGHCELAHTADPGVYRGALLLATSGQREGCCPFMQRCAQRSAMQHSPTHATLPLALLQKETHSTTPPQRATKGTGVTLRAVFLRRNPAARSPPALPVPSSRELPGEPRSCASVRQAGRGGHHAVLTPTHTACAPGVGQLLLSHREGSSGAADAALLGLLLAGDGAGKMR